MLGGVSVLLANCAGTTSKSRGFSPSKYGVSASARVVEPGQPVPKGGGTYRVGRPYVIAGRTYVPSDRPHRSEGVASWYGDDFHGRLTANGEVYDMHAISAAHPTMPMPSYARVTNLKSGRSLIVRVNDRGPYHHDRVIDLSSKAAELLQFRGHGISRVRVEYVGPAPLEGSDDRRLLATVTDGRPAPAPSQVRIAAAKPFVPEVQERVSVRRTSTITEVEEEKFNPRDIRAILDRPYGTGVSAGRGLY
ncbi:septal ring lytic transglycosylase RlpA family protein [Variibacter gotjawalensis]|nr:septal ring lytic transglycosylase RlpA family protein [Variibacter gotjawalensis]